VDSAGATVDFLLSARRNAAAAKRFFQKAFPRVINLDGNPSYPKVIPELKKVANWGAGTAADPSHT
jgi:transposase-like protein